MKNFLAPMLAVAAFAVGFVACTAAQKQAAFDLGLDSTGCVLGKLNEPFSQALAECGLSTITDPQKRADLLTLFSSAKAGATKAGATFHDAPDAGAEAGAK